MANSILEDDFLFWLIIFIICAPLAIVLLAWEVLGKRKRPERPVPQDFFYK
jgi:hypothetical protein